MSENSDDQQQFFLNGRRLSEMKVFQLQAELESRGLPTSGNKNQLIHRLENFLREHQEQEAQIHLEQQEQQQPEPSLQVKSFSSTCNLKIHKYHFYQNLSKTFNYFKWKYPYKKCYNFC